MHEGDEVTIIEDHGRLILDRQKRVDIDALIVQMSPKTFHDDPLADAPIVGAEMW